MLTIAACVALADAGWGTPSLLAQGQTNGAAAAMATADDMAGAGHWPAAAAPEERPGSPGWTYRLRLRQMLGGRAALLDLAPPVYDEAPLGGAAATSTADAGDDNSLFDLAAKLFSAPVSQTLHVLLLGSDRREGDSVWRTDTIILASLDPRTRQVHLLSLPRDLWVFIPGHGYGRINTADYLGHLDGLDEAALVRRAIGVNLGLAIDRYLLVDMAAFIAVVDAVGGLEVPVDCPLEDRLLENGPTDRPDAPLAEGPVNERVLELDTGMHHLDGRGVLAYARTRTGSSDLVRTRHQQRVLRALMHRARAGDLTARLPQLWRAMQGRVRTDLTIGELLYGAGLASSLSADDLHTRVLGPAELNDWTTPDGQQVLVLTPRGRAAVAEALGDDGGAGTAQDPYLAESGATPFGADPYGAAPIDGAQTGPFPWREDRSGPWPLGVAPFGGAPVGPAGAFASEDDANGLSPAGGGPPSGRDAPSNTELPPRQTLAPVSAPGIVAVQDASGHGDWGDVAAVRLQEAGLETRAVAADSRSLAAPADGETRLLFVAGRRELAEQAASALAIPLAAILESPAGGRPFPDGAAVLAVIGADWRPCPGGPGH